MSLFIRCKKGVAIILGTSMLFSAPLPAGFCWIDNEWTCWIGGAVLGAAVGAGTGYIAGGQHAKKGRSGPNGFPGPRGDRGPQGDPGLAGLPGIDGTDGADGLNGVPGRSGCDCPFVNTQTELPILFTSNGVTSAVQWHVEIYDPQRLIHTTATLNQGSSTVSFTIPADQPKLTGTYLIHWVVTSVGTSGATRLGDVIFNGTTFSTNINTWFSGQTFDAYVHFPE